MSHYQSYTLDKFSKFTCMALSSGRRKDYKLLYLMTITTQNWHYIYGCITLIFKEWNTKLAIFKVPLPRTYEHTNMVKNRASHELVTPSIDIKVESYSTVASSYTNMTTNIFLLICGLKTSSFE